MALPDGGTSHHAQFWRPFVEGPLRHGWTWLTGGDEATALWVPPGGDELTPEQEQHLVDLAHERLGSRAGAYVELPRWRPGRDHHVAAGPLRRLTVATGDAQADPRSCGISFYGCQSPPAWMRWCQTGRRDMP